MTRSGCSTYYCTAVGYSEACSYRVIACRSMANCPSLCSKTHCMPTLEWSTHFNSPNDRNSSLCICLTSCQIRLYTTKLPWFATSLFRAWILFGSIGFPAEVRGNLISLFPLDGTPKTSFNYDTNPKCLFVFLFVMFGKISFPFQQYALITACFPHQFGFQSPPALFQKIHDTATREILRRLARPLRSAR